MRFQFWPHKLTRYLFGEVVRACVGSLVFFVFVFILFQALRWVDFFIHHETPVRMLAATVSSLIISFLPLAVPLALLLGTLMAVGRLSTDSEIVAMQAAGMSRANLLVPLMVWGSLVAFVLWTLFGRVVPVAEYRFREQLIRIGARRVVASLKPGAFTSGFFGLIVFVESVDPLTQRLQNVFIFDRREPVRPVVVVAQEGRVLPVRAQTSLGAAAQMVLRDGTLHFAAPASNQYDVLHFVDYGLFMERAEKSTVVSRRPTTLSFPELNAELIDPGTSTQALRDLKTEWWRRFALSIASVIYAMFAGSFLSTHNRTARSSALLVTAGIMVVYWSVLVWGTNLSVAGTLPAPLALNLGNIAILLLTIFRLRRVFA